MSEPEYTKGKRIIEDGPIGNLRWIKTDNDGLLAEHDPCNVGGETPGNARLHAASDNAVLELAEHLGCNAILLAERLENGGLTEIAVALGTICAATEPGEDPDIGLLHRIASSALSHLTTPAPR